MASGCRCTAGSRLSRPLARIYSDVVLFRLPNVYARAHANLVDAWTTAPAAEFEAEWDLFARDLKHQWWREHGAAQLFFIVSVLLNVYAPHEPLADALQALATVAVLAALCFGFAYTVLMPDISGAHRGALWMQGAERIAASRGRSLPVVLAASSASIIWAMLSLLACMAYRMHISISTRHGAAPAPTPGAGAPSTHTPLFLALLLAPVALAHFGASFWAVRSLARGRGGDSPAADSPLADIERAALLEDADGKPAGEPRDGA